MSRADTSLADLFGAFDALRPEDAEAEEAILNALHFQRAPRIDPPHLWGAYDPGLLHDPARRPPGRRDAEPRRPRRPDPPAPPAPGPVGAVLSAVASPLPDSGTSREPPDWLQKVEPMPPAHVARAPEVEPLFARGQARGVLSAALATRSPEGRVDTAEVIRRLAALQPLRTLPRLPVPTLRRGVQVLLDLGPAMDPYATDREQLARQISEVAGGYRVQTLTFVGCPTRGVYPADGGEPRPWEPPPSGTPVALVSTLGLGGPRVDRERSTPAEWLDLADQCRAKGCPLLAFVPFAPDRWDPVLARALRIIHWDRWTTAGAVRRLVGPGHQVGR